MQSVSIPNPDKLQPFIDHMGAFLKQLTYVFPECSVSTLANNYFEATFGDQCTDMMVRAKLAHEMVMRWQDEIVPHYDLIKARDDSFFQMERAPDSICSIIEVNKKWTMDIGDETRQAIWEYMELFCNEAIAYSEHGIPVPAPVLSFCRKYAHLFEGGTDLKHMDADSLMTFAMTIQNKIPTEELETLAYELKDTDLQGLQDRLLDVLNKTLA